ncbi:MAG: hypothetical protein CL868_03670 [Cytophagaceae bacterium]|nr:hypothetical protein [Cytophagaceae bacterium]|tara:strand:- start:406 stop:651 length:246 start_codon:yes stop_codon:yes gene_type:complete
MIPLDITEGFPTFNWIIFTVIIIGYILNIICLFDISKLKYKGETKMFWIVILLMIPLMGGLAYLVGGRKQRVHEEEYLQDS